METSAAFFSATYRKGAGTKVSLGPTREEKYSVKPISSRVADIRINLDTVHHVELPPPPVLLPGRVSQQDCEAVAERTISPVEFILVGLHSPVKGGGEYTFTVKACSYNDTVLEHIEYVPKYDKLSKLDVERKARHNLSQHC